MTPQTQVSSPGIRTGRARTIGVLMPAREFPGRIFTLIATALLLATAGLLALRRRRQACDT